MNRYKLVLPILLIIFGACAKNSADAQLRADLAVGKQPRFSPAAVLRNMPQNSDLRCTGISLVAEALLAGGLLPGDGCDWPEELGKQIYESAKEGRRVKFHANLCLADGQQPIESRPALDRLSTVVADRFKQQFSQLMTTERGQQKLLAAQRTFVHNTRELDQLIEADSDKIVAMFLIGNRQFADGTVKDTAHAVLLQKQEGGRMAVYDPNDPGIALPCALEDTAEGLTIEWTCRYRDTGQVTTQTYYLIQKEAFFRLAFNN